MASRFMLQLMQTMFALVRRQGRPRRRKSGVFRKNFLDIKLRLLYIHARSLTGGFRGLNDPFSSKTRGSSNGRTAGSGPVNLGSNPSPRTRVSLTTWPISLIG